MSVNSDFWQTRRILVTGHTGFMGGWLTVLLKELGAKTTGYALAPPTDPSFFDTVRLGSLLDHDVRGDVRDLSALSQTIKTHHPEIIFHLAAQPLVREARRDPVGTFDVNCMGTVNVLEAARHHPSVRAIIVVTSDKVYDNVEWEWDYRESDRLGGREPYGVSKACAELVVEAYRRSFLTEKGIGVASVRAGNVIGGGDWASERLIPDIVRAFSKHETLIIRNPSATRPWQHVLEPLRGYLMLAERLFDQPTEFDGGWNFGPTREDHKPVSWIAETCARLWGDGARWQVDASPQPYEAHRLGVTFAKAELRLGWTPLWRIERALEHTIGWYQAKQAGRNMLKETIDDVRRMISLSPVASGVA